AGERVGDAAVAAADAATFTRHEAGPPVGADAVGRSWRRAYGIGEPRAPVSGSARSPGSAPGGSRPARGRPRSPMSAANLGRSGLRFDGTHPAVEPPSHAHRPSRRS